MILYILAAVDVADRRKTRTAGRRGDRIMRTSLMNDGHAHDLEHEFIPPLNARETWGMPWEHQIAAHHRWQEAGGNTDGQRCQWVDSALGQSVSPHPRWRPAVRQGHSQSRIAGDRRMAANEPYPMIERRHRTLAIRFPDRRMAG